MRIQKYDIQVLYVPYDSTEADFHTYINHMPWFSLPYGDPRIKDISKHYSVSGIPSLIILRNGTVISTNGRKDIKEKGPEVYHYWLNL